MRRADTTICSLGRTFVLFFGAHRIAPPLHSSATISIAPSRTLSPYFPHFAVSPMFWAAIGACISVAPHKIKKELPRARAVSAPPRPRTPTDSPTCSPNTPGSATSYQRIVFLAAPRMNARLCRRTIRYCRGCQQPRGQQHRRQTRRHPPRFVVLRKPERARVIHAPSTTHGFPFPAGHAPRSDPASAHPVHFLDASRHRLPSQ